MCEYEICPCRFHSIKIKNEFFDIFERVFTPQEELEIENRALSNRPE